MSRRENCWDNAVVESFFGTLKSELIYRRETQRARPLVAGLKFSSLESRGKLKGRTSRGNKRRGGQGGSGATVAARALHHQFPGAVLVRPVGDGGSWRAKILRESVGTTTDRWLWRSFSVR
ncbi:MAG: hypothetical protein K0U98_05725 [Deltaproteobacteria bacterium]|nr:hypothetical protein [Deltaproteobacteria bacterium]